MQAWKESRWQDAQRLLGHVVDNISADFKSKNPYQYAHLLNDCGYANLKVGDFTKAESLLSAGLAVRERQGEQEVKVNGNPLTGARPSPRARFASGIFMS